MRLIDADAFIASLNKYINKPMTTGLCATLVELFPTAYNVDKVVEQLEELNQLERNDECPMECICGNCEWSKYKCKGCYTGRAIEIVKRRCEE